MCRPCEQASNQRNEQPLEPQRKWEDRFFHLIYICCANAVSFPADYRRLRLPFINRISLSVRFSRQDCMSSGSLNSSVSVGVGGDGFSFVVGLYLSGFLR